MLHDIEAVPSVPALLTIIDGEGAVTDNRVQRFTKAIDVEAVGPDHLKSRWPSLSRRGDIPQISG